MKNKIIIEWDFPQGETGNRIREELLKDTSRFISATLHSLATDKFRPGSVFISSEHEELVTTKSPSELAYAKE